MKEEELQKFIAERLEDNDYNINNLITESSWDSILSKKKDEYGINEIVTQRYIRSVERVMQLIGDGEILCDNGKTNISINPKDKIQPDFVIYVEENDVYEIIELKVSGNAERQAVTEVTAYQAELMNYLPGLSYNHFPLIIIAQDYKALLRHSISSLLLDNQNVLCLSVNMDRLNNQNDDFLDVVECCTWEDIGWRLSKDSLHGRTICFYRNGSNHYSEKEMEDILNYGAQLICSEAEKIKSNGLVIAWKNHTNNNNYDETSTDYFLTYFLINPYTNYQDTGAETVIEKNIQKVKRESEGMNSLDAGSSFSDILKPLYSKDFSLHEEWYASIDEFLYVKQDISIVNVMYWGLLNELITESRLYNPLFKIRTLPELFSKNTYFANLTYLFDDRMKFDKSFDAFRMGILDEKYMNWQKVNYDYSSYLYSKAIWDRLEKQPEWIRLYNCGKNYAKDRYNDNSACLPDTRKCQEVIREWRRNCSNLDEADNVLIENCMIGYDLINYVMQIENIDENDDDIDSKVDNAIYDVINTERKREAKIISTIEKLDVNIVKRLIESYPEEMAFLVAKYSD